MVPDPDLPTLRHPRPTAGGARATGPAGSAPVLRRLLVLVTGSPAAVTVPAGLEWTRRHHPDVQIRVVLSPAATRFLSAAALAAPGRPAEFDRWPTDHRAAPHTGWQRWAQAILVYPATLGFLARLSLGMADTPALVVAQCTRAPVVVAPSLPSGARDSHAFREHRRNLRRRSSVLVAMPDRDEHTAGGEQEPTVPVPWPRAYELVQAAVVEGTGHHDAPPTPDGSAPGPGPRQAPDLPPLPPVFGVGP